MNENPYKLMVVDDERMIVNGLVQLIEDHFLDAVEVRKAYSGSEALAALHKYPVDILMTDIHMPAMTGLELQKEVKDRWPKCQMIFLTGFNDFEYVQEAIRNESTDYILKTEDDTVILDAIQKAITRLNNQFQAEAFLANAQMKMKQVQPILQKEFLWRILNEHEYTEVEQLQNQLTDLEIPLCADQPVLLVLTRIDDWGNKSSTNDRLLMQYAISNIVSEYMGSMTTHYSLTYDNHKFIWLIQVKQGDQSKIITNQSIPSYVYQNLEAIMTTCKQYLGVTLSMLAANHVVSWSMSASKFLELQRILNIQFATKQEFILLEPEEYIPIPLPTTSIQIQLSKIPMLGTYLETGQREPYFTLFVSLIKLVQDNSKEQQGIQLHLYYTIVSIYIAYLYQSGILHELSHRIDIQTLTHFEGHPTFESAVHYLQQTAEVIFSHKKEDIAERDREVVRKIKQYIKQNLAGDLSLTRIASLVGFNRSYLSRLYKQMTGKGLSEYIFEVRIHHAKTLLRQPQLKIHEISDLLGFESPAYFTRFFKKATNLTPTEYRELDH
ncbi:DNA-binding response regulator [Paenibacillus agaridevorans]|uniref:DNA-binding response regulator n=1 Tax=Paenibacillus agaridevorans TaxID=171404 RepID=A0A2R5EJD9_9BACL|nr:helix-turn-helix domain-containing protein [Paenibacillus agaridevorans]GBG05739.1 DNA-binding response regulator [Paenibacillus agaridevorans]